MGPTPLKPTQGEEEAPDGPRTWSRRESGVDPPEDGLLGAPGFEEASAAREGYPGPPPGVPPAPGPFLLGVSLTSCSLCHHCHSALYDEEIMAGWGPSASNLNTRCVYCSRDTVPALTVSSYDICHLPKSDAPCLDRSAPPAKAQMDAFQAVKSKAGAARVVEVPYLSPLVLRKELETVLGSEGDQALLWRGRHDALYWNMIWYFSRLQLPTHYPGLFINTQNLHPSWGPPSPSPASPASPPAKHPPFDSD